MADVRSTSDTPIVADFANANGTPLVVDRVNGVVYFLDADNVVTAISGGSGGGVPTSRLINTTAPLAGGGDLTADRTLSVATFGTGASGVVPASGGGTSNFLRADGSWAAPAGGSGYPSALGHSR